MWTRPSSTFTCSESVCVDVWELMRLRQDYRSAMEELQSVMETELGVDVPPLESI